MLEHVETFKNELLHTVAEATKRRDTLPGEWTPESQTSSSSQNEHVAPLAFSLPARESDGESRNTDREKSKRKQEPHTNGYEPENGRRKGRILRSRPQASPSE